MGIGYLLVLHGSHDPRYQVAIGQLKDQLAQRLPPDLRYALAYLECAETPLSQQILDFARVLQGQGCRQMQILPLFLQPGVHVMEDIPAQVAAAQSELAAVTLDVATDVEIVVRPYLGSDFASIDLFDGVAFPSAEASAEASTDGQRLLVAHGTKRPGGNQGIADLADRLGAQAAYWFVAPSVPEQVTALYAQGVRRIVLLPYVLMAGSLTEGIAAQVRELQAQFPDLQLHQLPALVESGKLVNWLAGQLA